MRKRDMILVGFTVVAFSAAPASAGAALVFSEIMYDLPGSDTKREWVELINCGPDAITIATGSGSGSWRFNDGSPHILSEPAQGSATLAANDVLVLVADAPTFLAEHAGVSGTVFDTVMNLKNTSSTLQLIDAGGAVTANAMYESGIGAKGNGRTLERQTPCASPAELWQESAADGGTPGIVPSGTPPPPPPPPPDPPAGGPPPAPSGSAGGSSPQPPPKPLPRVALSEFLPDPVGDDSTGEWIEITNLEDREADVSGLMLDDSTAGGAYAFPGKTSIAPKAYLAIARADSKIALTNTGDEVKLMWPSGEFIEVITFGKAPEGAAYAKGADGAWHWTYQPTRSAPNVFAEKPEQPRAASAPATTLSPQQPADAESDYEGRVEQAQVAAQLPLNAEGTQTPHQRTTQLPAALPGSNAAPPAATPTATTSQLLAAALPNQSPNIPPWLLGMGVLAGGALAGGLASRFLIRGV